MLAKVQYSENEADHKAYKDFTSFIPDLLANVKERSNSQ
jgi:hypothetical protein